MKPLWDKVAGNGEAIRRTDGLFSMKVRRLIGHRVVSPTWDLVYDGVRNQVAAQVQANLKGQS